MRRMVAAAGSAVFFVVAPGTIAGLVPWQLTGWRVGQPPFWMPVRVFGLALFAAGVIVLVQAFARFVREGLGTPAPVAPPEGLVIGGLYRRVRNPMYLAVVATILGQGLVLARPVLFPYAALVLAAMAAFVLGYEQPTLRRRFGASYEAYRRAVPAWWPRLRPWRPEDGDRQDGGPGRPG